MVDFLSADILHERARAIRAVRGQAVNAFSRALEALDRLAESLGAPIAIVGGLAGIHHRALVTTVDIDVVVPQDRLDAILVEAPRHGFRVHKTSPDGWHGLVFEDPEGDVPVEVIPEGRRSPRDPPHAPPVPSPQELGVESGLGYASFAGWVAMKLVAARDKDRYHLGEALKQASQEQIAEAVLAVRRIDPSYLQELQRLLRAAEEENQEYW
jgi:hypothetical protein